SSADVSATLGDALGDAPEVKTYGQSSDLLIRSSIGGDINELENRLVDAIDAAYPGSNTQVLSTNSVGPRIADDLKSGAILAVLFSLGIILAYIWIRFAWRFGVGAVAALAHDVTIVLGVFSLLHEFVPFELEINQVIIGALLTIVGYSLNDTVVVFDRIREYSSVYKTVDYEGMVNRAINSTLSRTIVTSGTTFIVVLVLFLFGGEVLSGFAFALILGILIGTYSSIFVASPIVVELHNRTTKKVVA
ncbi:MAG: protein translocase subunit SecF, partial [Bacteroidota bacterium]